MTRSEERCSSSQFNWKPGRFNPYASNDRVSQQPDLMSSFPAWKERSWQANLFLTKPAKGSKHRK